MRNAITAISSMLFGASVLIFILALIIPLLRESPSQAGKIAGLEQGHSESPSVNTDLQPSLTQPQGEIVQNQPKELNVPAQPVDVSGLPSPNAPNESAIDRSRDELSDMQPLQPSITPLQGGVVQNQPKELNASTQPVDASGLLSPIAPNDTANDRSQGELNVMQSQQSPPQTIIPKIKEKSTNPVNPSGAEEKSPPRHEPTSLLILGEGLFPVGEGRPKANLQKAIDNIIPLIRERASDKVVVEGHADRWIPNGVSSIRVSNFNKIVSLQRASVVAKVLEQKGIAHDRIIVKGLGDEVPLASNLTREGRAKNRRVEIKLSPTQ